MGSVATSVAVHGGGTENPAVDVHGDYGRAGRRLQPDGAALLLGHVQVVGVGLAGGDDLPEERPDGRPVLGGGFSDLHDVPSILTGLDRCKPYSLRGSPSSGRGQQL